MTDLDRVGNSGEFSLRGVGVPSFLQVCEKRRRQRGNIVARLHGDVSAIYQ